MKRTVWLLVGLALGIGSVAWAQSPPPLADIARKEAERRKTIKTPSKVYTNEDVAKTRGVMTSAAPVAAARPPESAAGQQAGEAAGQPTPGAAAAAATASPPEGPANDETYWRNRMVEAREKLRRSQMFADALQTRVNALTADFYRWDDPSQRAVIGQQRDEAIAELNRVKKEIDDQTQAIADLEDEARRAGVPPGWLR